MKTKNEKNKNKHTFCCFFRAFFLANWIQTLSMTFRAFLGKTTISYEPATDASTRNLLGDTEDISDSEEEQQQGEQTPDILGSILKVGATVPASTGVWIRHVKK